MTPQSDTAAGGRLARLLNTPLFPGVGGLCLALFLLAWPWEIFQRLPFGGTAVYAAAAGVILSVGGEWRQESMLQKYGPDYFLAVRGFIGPILLLALACAQSAVHSHDIHATMSLLRQYGFYLALFLAALPLLRSPEDNAAAWRLLACSAALVAALALACAAGWLTPALAGTQEYFGRRLTEDVRFGAFVRIAAATPDFNQAILPMLLSLPAAALLFTRHGVGLPRLAVPVLMVALLAGGVLVSFSRSGLIAVAALGAAALAWRFRAAGRRHPLRTAGLALSVALAAVALLHAGGYLEMLVFRALRGFNSPDPSYRSRLYVFGLAWKLLPDFWFLGCGLGAAPEAIGRAADPRLWMGTAIHSMPFLMLFETGILGLAGYFWFWGALFRRIWTGLLRSDDAERRRLGMVLAATAALLFWMLAIQPFQALSLFPVLAAMLAAPCAPQEAETAQTNPGHVFSRAGRPCHTKWRPWGVALGAAALAALVAWNITQYHRTIARVDAYAKALERGMAAELRGDWDGAEAKYREARDLTGMAEEFPHILDAEASGAKLGDYFASYLAGAPIKNLAYYSEAVNAADLGFLLERLPGGGFAGVPFSVALFGMARAAHGRGDFAGAATLLEACKHESGDVKFWPELCFAQGDAYWRDGLHGSALWQWYKAAEMAPKAPPRHALSPKPPFTELLAEMDAEYQWLEAEGDGGTLPRRIMLLARMGRAEAAWEKLEAAWPAALQEEQAFWRGVLTVCDDPAPEPLQ